MYAPRGSRRAFLLSVIACLATVGAPTGNAFGEQTTISWQTVEKLTALEINKGTREGTATFANGETAQIVSHAVFTSTNTWNGGTASVVSVYKFDDGSGFTLRWVSIYNVLVHRCIGLFSEGLGRFAGIAGSATGGGEPPGRAALIVGWTGTYELKN